MLAQQIVSGIATGSLYALTAIGIVLIFRNTRTINLARATSAWWEPSSLVVLERFKGNLFVGARRRRAVTLLAVAVEAARHATHRAGRLADAVHGDARRLLHLHAWRAGSGDGTRSPFGPCFERPCPSAARSSARPIFQHGGGGRVGAVSTSSVRFTKPGIAMRAITEDPVAAH